MGQCGELAVFDRVTAWWVLPASRIRCGQDFLLVLPTRDQRAVLRYLWTARVRKTAMMTTDQSSDAHTGCCIGQASGTG